MDKIDRLDPDFNPVVDLISIKEYNDNLNELRGKLSNIKEINSVEDMFYDGYEEDFLLLRTLIILELGIVNSINDRYTPITFVHISNKILLFILKGEWYWKEDFNQYESLYLELEREWFNLTLRYFDRRGYIIGLFKEISDVLDDFVEEIRKIENELDEEP